MNKSMWKWYIVIGFALSMNIPTWALLRNGGNYGEETKIGPDSQTGGWFINLGITGARGKMTPSAPTVIEVAYVFKDTPADGELQAGDKIIGANGKPFTTPHKFGYGMEKFGYEGPMMDLGNALDESQGPRLNGKIILQIIRGQKRQQIALKLPTKYGSFSQTYPFNCKKTDTILDELYAYLIKRQQNDGSWHHRPHLNAIAALALLTSRKQEHKQAIQKAMHYFANNTNDKIDYAGYDCWKYGLYGICLSEYYLLTGENWVLKELDEINRWLVKAQFQHPYRDSMGAGGWGHRPTGREGGNGYGPICMITAQALAAWSLIAECNLDINQKQYMAAHKFLVRGTNNIGYVWYNDNNAGDNKYADMGRTGSSGVAHAVSSLGGTEFQDYAFKAAKCIGTNYKTFPDTHGSAILGMGWTALGAAVDKASFRNLMDNHIWYFSLAHCPNGTFYFQPNRDPNAQDYHAAPRLSASAVTALILSIKHKSLRIMGAKDEW